MKEYHYTVTSLQADDHDESQQLRKVLVAGYNCLDIDITDDDLLVTRIPSNNEATETAKQPDHPMQPIILDEHQTARFKENKIVRFLLDAGPFDMNQLAVAPFDDGDREQFAQLIGYSVSGFGDVSYSRPESVAEADEIAASFDAES